MARTQSDRELALGLARGDARAVDAFYREHFDAVYEFVFFRVGRSREDAEDVTSETFLTALRRIGEFEGRATLAAWVRGIARNKCRERIKALARVKARQAPLLDAAGLDVAGLDRGDLPQKVLESAETALAVAAALSQLPVRYSRALIDKYVDELTFAEIAERSESSAKAVESLVQRAKTAFARILGAITRSETRSFP